MKNIAGFLARSGLALTLSLAILAPSSALAQAYDDYDEYDYDKGSWPVSLTRRPLVLAPGMLEVSGDTMIINLSAGLAGDPITLAPDIYYGVNRQLSVGIDHQRGICISSGCPTSYEDLSLYALYSVMHGGSFDLAVLGGPGFPYLNDFAMGANVGVRAKLMVGSIALVAGAELYLGIIGRDGAKPRTEGWVHIPVELQVQLQKQSAVIVTFGFDGPLSGYGSNIEIPVGVGALFALNNRIDLGGEFRFTNFVNDAGLFDGRALIVRAALRL
jgi:hypothetical protein